ncbi:MAG: 1-acyl-sn-glycerol-3-phosphate acyltransferase [Deltaproteobacteria bacterium]
MKRFFGSLFLKLWGWKVIGQKPLEDKLLIVVFHHTSAWDFPVGLFTRWKMGLDISFVGKASLFKFPLGILMRYLGGYPVERDPEKKTYSVTKQIEDLINKNEKIYFNITPEGTRKKVDKLKTGFYTIAINTGIKILLVAFDFPRKTVTFGVPHIPAPTFDEEMQILKAFYKDTKGKYPELSFDFSKV